MLLWGTAASFGIFIDRIFEDAVFLLDKKRRRLWKPELRLLELL